VQRTVAGLLAGGGDQLHNRGLREQGLPPPILDDEAICGT